jgi:hypothetical protein
LKLSLNRSVLPASCLQKMLSSADPSSVVELLRRVDETSVARSWGALTLRKFMVPKRIMKSWRLKVGRDSVEPWNSSGAMNIR